MVRIPEEDNEITQEKVCHMQGVGGPRATALYITYRLAFEAVACIASCHMLRNTTKPTTKKN